MKPILIVLLASAFILPVRGAEKDFSDKEKTVIYMHSLNMLKDYQRTTTGGEEFGSAAADEQDITDVARQITDMSVSGTEMIDSWVSKTGAMWTLVELDVEGFKDAVSRMGHLSETIRKAVQERSAESFAEMDEQLDK